MKINTIAASVLLTSTGFVYACTSFVSGNTLGGMPAILAKVRDTSYSVDQSSKHTEDLRFFHKNGLAYVALMYGQESPGDGSRDFISVGTNEKGLSVALNYATSQRSRIKTLYPAGIAKQESESVKFILESATTIVEAKNKVAELYEQGKLVPEILTMTDGEQGMIIEIALDENNKIHYETKSTGIENQLYTANHFVMPAFNNPNYNVEVTEDSLARYKRIVGLFAESQKEKPFTISTAVRFSKDYDEGENNSIFRYQSRATYIAQGNQEKSTLFIELTNTAQLYNRAVLTLDKNFWMSHNDGDVIIAFDQPYKPKASIHKFITY